MRELLPPPDGPLDPSWWAPLEGVARLVVGEPAYQFFDLGDFMLMARLVRPPRPAITLYKHYWTRRYLNLDDAGHAYRYIAPREYSTSNGRYVAHRNLKDALDHLRLWELPWMKSSLDAYRFGRTWEERWALHPDVIAESLGSPSDALDDHNFADDLGHEADDGCGDHGVARSGTLRERYVEQRARHRQQRGDVRRLVVGEVVGGDLEPEPVTGRESVRVGRELEAGA